MEPNIKATLSPNWKTVGIAWSTNLWDVYMQNRIGPILQASPDYTTNY